MTTAVMHRLSIAIEAIEQCRKSIRGTASDSRNCGTHAADATLSAIRAQTHIEQALKDLVEATKEEAAE
jgi:hypothetical protein